MTVHCATSRSCAWWHPARKTSTWSRNRHRHACNEKYRKRPCQVFTCRSVSITVLCTAIKFDRLYNFCALIIIKMLKWFQPQQHIVCYRTSLWRKISLVQKQRSSSLVLRLELLNSSMLMVKQQTIIVQHNKIVTVKYKWGLQRRNSITPL